VYKLLAGVIILQFKHLKQHNVVASYTKLATAALDHT